MLVFDLFAQQRFLRGPLFSPPAFTAFYPWLGLALGALCLFWRAARRPAIGLLAAVHYVSTYQNGQFYTEADAWVWLLVSVLVCIPDRGDETESYWVGVLKLVGFLVYLFAGLHKVIRPEWWNGEALVNIFQDRSVMNERYLFIAQLTSLSRFFCWATLVQRLIVPWGFWSNRLWVRRSSAGLLAVMHYCYMMAMNVGTFSWVGITYLSLYFFRDPHPERPFYRLPAGKRRFEPYFAAAFTAYILFLPTIDLIATLRPQELGWAKADVHPPGLLMYWGMFADTRDSFFEPELTLRTCTGKEVSGDDAFWALGQSRDYFRRRVAVAGINQELMDGSHRGPLELQVLARFPELVAERRAVIFKVSAHEARTVAYDSGYERVNPCPAVFRSEP